MIVNEMNVQSSRCLVSNSTNMSNFNLLEVVSRCREPQLQVSENVFFLNFAL